MRKSSIRKYFLLAVFLLTGSLCSFEAYATHLRAGNITVKRESCSGLTFTITITAYTNSETSVIFSDSGLGILDFGDNSPVNNPPPDRGSGVPGFDAEFLFVTYSIKHTYKGPGRYTISYYEHNRNANILNMSLSVNTPFYIETQLNIDPFLGCDNSPVLTVPPIDKACVGTAWFHNPGAYDPDGDSISYEMVVPKQSRLNNVNGYRDPNDASFYGGNHNIGNEDHNNTPGFGIDPISGLITWDAPGRAGEYNIAFHIIEWRKVSGIVVQMGYVRRDMQIIVEDCNNHRPELQVPADICVEAGTLINEDIFATDPDSDSVKIEAFSQVFSINPSPASVSTPASNLGFQRPPGKLHFTWQTECAHVKEQSYQVIFKVTDKPKINTGGVALVQFKTWNIKVVAPAPKWTSVVATGDHHAQLTWQPYVCSNAELMQVWRRVESFPYTPGACVTGMPPFLGYTKIAEVSPITTTHYLDTNNGQGLAPGAQYCYRLVAAFRLPAGGLSYVSTEACFTVVSDAPVITNVSIDRTDAETGEDTVRWQSPQGLDVVSYPPPYSYGVYRAEGFSAISGLTQITPGKIADTLFIDKPLDTENKIYNYRVIAYASNGTMIDTSATASTVRLEVRPHLETIDLSWSAAVPWSNVLSSHPLHTVFRGPEGSKTLSDLSFLADVDVTSNRFTYTDQGPLDRTKKYCYCVRTVGGYGNPKIKEPLYNYSQITCVQPNDTIPPCAVVINATGTNCADVYKSACAPSSFNNLLTWARPTRECQEEAYRYRIYVASQTGGSFTLYRENVLDTFFVDTNLASYARCYKVSAISRSGIEGPLSDSFCFDNCPNYELPNVFTPGNNDQCNDLFSAYSDRHPVVEGPQPLCPPRSDIQSHCARFVNSVHFTVYNRWGKEVYSYESGGENSIYIDWDGKDDQGKDLSNGIYYYIAEVNFNVVNPSQQNKTIKGWVQIVRS